jgi:hypothetical protein
MPSCEMLRSVALVRTQVSEERINSIIRVTRIGVLGTKLTVTSNRSTLPARRFLSPWMMDAIRSSETSILKGETRCNIPEDGLLLSQRGGNHISKIALKG